MVAEDIREGRRGDAVARQVDGGGEESVRDGEDGEGGAVVEI